MRDPADVDQHIDVIAANEAERLMRQQMRDRPECIGGVLDRRPPSTAPRTIEGVDENFEAFARVAIAERRHQRRLPGIAREIDEVPDAQAPARQARRRRVANRLERGTQRIHARIDDLGALFVRQAGSERLHGPRRVPRRVRRCCGQCAERAHPCIQPVPVASGKGDEAGVELGRNLTGVGYHGVIESGRWSGN